MLANVAYSLARQSTFPPSQVFMTVRGEALSADDHQVSFNLYMGQNARGATNSECVFGGSFIVK
jgi:hypothetical protein